MRGASFHVLYRHSPFDRAAGGAFLMGHRERRGALAGQPEHKGGVKAETGAVEWGTLAVGHSLWRDLISGKSGTEAEFQLEPMVPLFLRIDKG